MKTAQDMIDSITSQIQSEIAKAEKATLANHVSMRRITLNAIRELWDIAAVTPQKSAEVGNVVYVSKSEANKYGRYGKLESQIVASNTSGLSIDKSVVERTGATVYQSQYNGSAWVYQQGYELPVTGSARAKLIANALYSDFSGDTFEGYLKSNWSKYTNDILSTVTRALNQGKSYAQIAREVRDLADANYARSLRVAATEAHRIQSQAQMDSIALLDEVDVAYVKMWVASIDDKTRESHQYMDGKYADKDGVFHCDRSIDDQVDLENGIFRVVYCRTTI